LPNPHFWQAIEAEQFFCGYSLGLYIHLYDELERAYYIFYSERRIV